MNALEILNGKKTMIGASMATVIGAVTALAMVWGWDALPWWPKAMQTVNIAAGLLSGTGLVHKIIKWQKLE